MQGSTDGGKHIEAMRRTHMKVGHCAFCKKWQGGEGSRLERHHEKYQPERTIYLCHHCHHKVHFRPYHLTKEQKDRLLEVRHGPLQWLAYLKKPRVLDKLRTNYVAPGRRKAQLKLRKKLRAHKT